MRLASWWLRRLSLSLSRCHVSNTIHPSIHPPSRHNLFQPRVSAGLIHPTSITHHRQSIASHHAAAPHPRPARPFVSRGSPQARARGQRA
ncbi:hypothetical protein IWZ03DRAFT_368068 [Phyllosticta citriasiana]|uniref:Secreted protein n=1 Tax=Phyllosticta citriasiana TaxID=595635 RepID=A0ABR1L0Z9_9PEZI